MASDGQGPNKPKPAKTIFGYAAPEIPGPGGPGQTPTPGQGPMGAMPPGPAMPTSPQGQAPAAPPAAQQPPPGQAPAGQWGQQPGQPAAQPPGGQWGGQPGQPAPAPGQPAAPAGGQWGQQQAAPPAGQPAGGQWGQQPQAPAPGQPAAPAQGHAPQGQAQGQAWGQQGQEQAQQAQAQGQAWGQQAGQAAAAPGQWGGQAQAAGQQAGGDAMADIAGRLPQSAPGTIFGVKLSTLQDASFQRKVLLISGIALVAAAFTPWSFSPLIFGWKMNAFKLFVWPIVAGGAYLLVAAAPPDMRQKVPPMVLQWLPFGVALLSIFLVGWGMGMMGGGLGGAVTMLNFTYPLLIFGLILRQTRPDDPYARWIIGAAAAAHIWPLIWWLSNVAFNFSGTPVFFIIHNLCFMVVLAVGSLCILFIPPLSMKPQFKMIDAFAPIFTAVLVLWLPIQLILLMLVGLNGNALGAILGGAHALAFTVAFFAVFILTAPPAYEELKKLFESGGLQQWAQAGHQAQNAQGQWNQAANAAHNPAGYAANQAQHQAQQQVQGHAQQQWNQQQQQGQPQQGQWNQQQGQPQQGQPQQGQWNQQQGQPQQAQPQQGQWNQQQGQPQQGQPQQGQPQQGQWNQPPGGQGGQGGGGWGPQGGGQQ